MCVWCINNLYKRKHKHIVFLPWTQLNNTRHIYAWDTFLNSSLIFHCNVYELKGELSIYCTVLILKVYYFVLNTLLYSRYRKKRNMHDIKWGNRPKYFRRVYIRIENILRSYMIDSCWSMEWLMAVLVMIWLMIVSVYILTDWWLEWTLLMLWLLMDWHFYDL